MKTANIRLPEAFGDRISFLRKLKGLTQAQLAEKLGISAQAVSKWESGGVHLDKDTTPIPR